MWDDTESIFSVWVGIGPPKKRRVQKSKDKDKDKGGRPKTRSARGERQRQFTKNSAPRRIFIKWMMVYYLLCFIKNFIFGIPWASNTNLYSEHFFNVKRVLVVLWFFLNFYEFTVLIEMPHYNFTIINSAEFR